MSDKFAALKAARAGASRLKQYQPDDADIYDEVTDDQYKQIVGNRLARDDFIEDDDGSGYHDNGMDYWDDDDPRGGRGEDQDDSEESEDGRGKKARKSKSTTLMTSKPKPKPKSQPLPPTRAQQAPSAYRPTVSKSKEDDFMAALLGDVTDSRASAVDVPREKVVARSRVIQSRKRKSSPVDQGSSEEEDGSDDPRNTALPSSDGTDFPSLGRNGTRPRLLANSSEGPFDEDEEEGEAQGRGGGGGGAGVWDRRPVGKRARVSLGGAGGAGAGQKRGVTFKREEDDDDVDMRAPEADDVAPYNDNFNNREANDDDDDDEEEAQEDLLLRATAQRGQDAKPIQPLMARSAASDRLKAMTTARTRSNGPNGASASSNNTHGNADATSTATVRSRKSMINGTSVSAKVQAQQAANAAASRLAVEVKSEPLASHENGNRNVNRNGNTNGSGAKTPSEIRRSWMSIQETLNTGTGAKEEEEPLGGTPFTEAAAEKKKYAPMIRTDAFEVDPDQSGAGNKMDVNSDDEETFSRPAQKKNGRTAKEEMVEEKERTLRMYWLDYLEADGGIVHLIGKAFDRNSGKYISCCVTVEGMQRNLFVLPRTKRMENGFETDVEPSPMDIHQELDSVRRKHGIEGRFAVKKVNRKYAFELEDVPRGESEWYKVVYPFSEPAIPNEVTGATFSKIFGTGTSAFETFVIKRKIMGPCWLEIKGCVQVTTKPASWCRLEAKVHDPKNVSPISDSDPTAPKEAPPMTVMSLAVRTIVNHALNTQELLAVTATVWENYNIDDPTPVEKLLHSPFTVVRPLGERFPPNFEMRCKKERQIQTVRGERELLNTLLSIIQRNDPDVIVGHELLGTNLEVILQRMKDLKADHWSRIGRFRRTQLKIGRMWYSNTKYLGGRLVADLSSDGAKGMIDSVTWSMTEMCQNQLGFTREDIDPDDTAGYFDGYAVSPDRLLHFVRHLQMDAFAQMAINSKVQFLPLTRQLTNLAGNSWNRTLTGARAERNEFILLHEFHRLKYICPDKGEGKASSRQAKKPALDEDGTVIPEAKRAKYQGGLVFEPKRGLWDTYILVMDFNSLYPSIIQEYNIDFTTVERHDDVDAVDDAIPDAPEAGVPQGVLPRLIATLVNRRKQVKGLMKSKSATATQLLQYDIRQKALKLTANSMYGCLGFAGSRFYARPLAALTTFKGRETLTATKELAESLALDVVYGDTDSVFVNSNVTDYAEAIKIANEFKKHVNDRYKLLEIDLDAVFSRVLLLQKKKYAAVKVAENGSSTVEIKGLDMVRREYCQLSKKASKFVLDAVLSGKATEEVVSEIHEFLTATGTELKENKIDLDDLIVFKRLGKDPEDYPDKKSQPHVQVALRMKQKGTSAKAGDVIPYLFCLGADGKSARTAQADRAFHPDEFRRQGSELKIDFDFYLSQQVLPPIERLCDEIEGTDRARLAECLGLDPARYQTQVSTSSLEKEFFTFESQISDKERFREADPLVLRCRTCKTESVFASLVDDVEKGQFIQNAGISCGNCSQILGTASVSTQVEIQIRDHIARYYKSVLVCSDCSERTRSMGVYGRRCMARERCRGEMRSDYPDSKLYTQLLYYASLFDVEKAIATSQGLARADEVQALALHNKPAFNEIFGMVNQYLDKCGRRYVVMKSLFGFMGSMTVA